MSSNAKIAAVGAVVVAAVLGAGLWWFLRDDAPDEVSLESATASVSTTEAPDGGTAGPDAGVEGEWVVDTTSGGFDFESATGTFAGFRVAEELVGIGATEAVGRTGSVSGSMTIEGTTVTAATIEIDLASITTNDGRRDNRVRDALETDRFPTASFVLSEPIELGDAAEAGDPVSVTATGELTVREVTNTVEFPLEAQLVDGTVVVVGSLEVVFADYGVQVPSAPIVVSAADRGPIELQLLFTRP
jgi:polyisoprenoid-binding protein YceI